MESQPLPPKTTCPPCCFTCGQPLAHLWLNYCYELHKMVGSQAELPVRSIGDVDISKRMDKGIPGKILDDFGIFRYCCRNNIMSQPREENKVPIPVKELEEFRR